MPKSVDLTGDAEATVEAAKRALWAATDAVSRLPDPSARAVLTTRLVQLLTDVRADLGQIRTPAVAELREKMGQAEVARLLGVSVALVRQIEREHKNLDPRYRPPRQST
jgi:DNA-binding transcriptional regulator YiaG